VFASFYLNLHTDFLAERMGVVQVRILSLAPEDVMSVLAVQAVPNVPDSLLLIDSTAADISGKGEDAAGAGGLFLNIGEATHQCLDCCTLHSL
jgi:hypothetical protein